MNKITKSLIFFVILYVSLSIFDAFLDSELGNSAASKSILESGKESIEIIKLGRSIAGVMVIILSIGKIIMKVKNWFEKNRGRLV